MTGALKVFAPLQPALGLVSLALLAWSLRVRLRGEIACPAPLSTSASATRGQDHAERASPQTSPSGAAIVPSASPSEPSRSDSGHRSH